MKSSTFKYGCSFAVSCCIAGVVLSGCGESVRDVAYYKNNLDKLTEMRMSDTCKDIMKDLESGVYRDTKEPIPPRVINCFYASKAFEFLSEAQQNEVIGKQFEIEFRKSK